jgi:5-enolpyruvylshikimate-3-phosphate synthase
MWRQARPDKREVTVAPVIAEIDALRRVGCTAEPENARAGKRPGKAAQGSGGKGVQDHRIAAAVAIIA